MDLFLFARNAPRSSARVLQRSESLPHVMEFAQRRFKLVRTGAVCAFFLRMAFAAAAKVNRQQRAKHGEGNETRNDHFRGFHADDRAF